MTVRISLSQRLSRIAELVLPAQPVLDVGTDHGYLPAYLVCSGRVPHAIAMDVRPRPLGNAQELAKRLNLGPDVFSTRLSDGLAAFVPGEATTLTISGMGGATIQRILSADIEKTDSFQRLVLQPNNAEAGIRRWLANAGWALCGEELIFERDQFYWIFVAERSTQVPAEMWTEKDFVLGPLLRHDPPDIWVKYLTFERDRLRPQVARTALAKDPSAPRIVQLRQHLKWVEAELEDLG